MWENQPRNKRFNQRKWYCVFFFLDFNIFVYILFGVLLDVKHDRRRSSIGQQNCSVCRFVCIDCWEDNCGVIQSIPWQKCLVVRHEGVTYKQINEVSFNIYHQCNAMVTLLPFFYLLNLILILNFIQAFVI